MNVASKIAICPEEAQAFKDGRIASDLGLSQACNPYRDGTLLSLAWDAGWEASLCIRQQRYAKYRRAK